MIVWFSGNLSKRNILSASSDIIVSPCYSMNPDRIESVASFVAKRFNDPALQHNGIKWVWLSDYVDSTIR